MNSSFTLWQLNSLVGIPANDSGIAQDIEGYNLSIGMFVDFHWKVYHQYIEVWGQN